MLVDQPSPLETSVPAAENRGVIVSMATLYVLWSTTYMAIAVAVETLPPFLMAGTRFLIAGVLFYAWLRMRGEKRPPMRQWVNAGVIGVFLLVGGNGFLTLAETSISSGTAAILVSTSSIWTTLFAGFAGMRPRPMEWLGIACGMTGVVLLNLNDTTLQASPIGAGLVLSGAMLWAAGSIISLRLEMPRSGMSTAVQLLVAGVVMLAASPFLGEELPAAPSAASLLAFVYLIGVSIAGFTAYNFALRNARPALATSYVYVNPMLAVTLGAVFLGEAVTASTLGAMAFVVTGVLLVIFARRLRRR